MSKNRKSETCYEGKISGGWPTRMFDLPENLKGLYFMHSPRRFFSQASKAADGRRRIEKFHFFLLLHCFLASNSNNNFWLQSHKFLIGSIKMTLSSTLKGLTVIEKYWTLPKIIFFTGKSCVFGKLPLDS